MQTSDNLRTLYLARLHELRGIPPAVAHLAAKRHLSEDEQATISGYVREVCEEIQATRDQVYGLSTQIDADEAMLDEEDEEEEAWSEFEALVESHFHRHYAS